MFAKQFDTMTVDEKTTEKINELIEEFGINKSILAKKMNMPDSTFRLRLSCNNDKYNFKSSELETLLGIIKDLSKKSASIT